MSRFAKIVAWLTLLHSSLTIVILGTIFLRGQSLPAAPLVIWSGVSVLGLVASVYALKAQLWGFWLLFVIYLIQVADYSSPGAFFSFMGPISVKLGWGWYSPPSHFNLNLLAIAACIFIFVCARGLTIRSSGPL